MPIPSSNFCMTTVKNEFVGPGDYFNEPKLTCFLYGASQNTITVGNMSGCSLSQFANKCRGSAIGSPESDRTSGDGGTATYCVCVSQLFSPGDDMRPTNSTSTNVYMRILVETTGQPSYEIQTSNLNITSNTTYSDCVIFYHPDPGNRVDTQLSAVGVASNGFGAATGSSGFVPIIPLNWR